MNQNGKSLPLHNESNIENLKDLQQGINFQSRIAFFYSSSESDNLTNFMVIPEAINFTVKGRLGWNIFYRGLSNIECNLSFHDLIFCVFEKSSHDLDVHERNNAASEVILPNCELEKEALCSYVIHFSESSAWEIP